MKRGKKMRFGKMIAMCAATMLLALTLGLGTEQFLLVSHAQSQGKVIATSANIRKEPSSTSKAVGSAFKDSVVTINHQTTASDGTIWYQVFVDADTLGYIRSDLVQITDGTTPPTKTSDTPATPTTEPSPETPASVEEVNPVSASVTGSQKVRVRSNASTTSQIVTAVEKGMVITVTGKANGTDGKVWYQVNFINNGTEVKGFIRSDYVALSGELTPPQPQDPIVDPPSDIQPDTPEVSNKDYETSYENEKWYLISNVEGVKYAIEDMFNAAGQNQQLYTDWEKEHKKVKSQKTVIILLVILMIVMAGGIAFLVLKIKDMMDSAYFKEVERDTLRRRNESRAQGGSQRVMHTVGADKQNGGRPTGAKPAQGSRPAQGTGTSQGSRPAQGTGAAQGSRPAQGTGTSQGSRPAQGAGTGQGSRPAQGTGAGQGSRPAQGTGAGQGSRPAQGAGTGQGSRPAQGAGTAQDSRPVQGAGTAQGSRPAQGAGTAQGSRPAQGTGTAQSAPKQTTEGSNPGWKSKNFMQDDDEFEFEFLHWDGEEDN